MWHCRLHDEDLTCGASSCFCCDILCFGFLSIACMKLVKTFHIQDVSDDAKRTIHPKIIESLEADKMIHTWKSSLVLAAYCMKNAEVCIFFGVEET